MLKHITLATTWLGALAALSGCGSNAANQLLGARDTDTRTLTISVLDKTNAHTGALAIGGSSGASAPYFKRWATPTAQIYVAATAQDGAFQTQTVTVGADDDLALVEGHPLPATMPGEVFRAGEVAAVIIAKGLDEHTALGSHMLHAQRVGTREIAPRDAADFAVRDAATPLAARNLGDLPAAEPAWLEAKLREFSGDTPVVIRGRTLQLTNRRAAVGREDARAWMRREYEALGFTVSDVPYGSGLSGGTNLVAMRAADVPNSDGYVVISAHLDSMSNPGADDDGSGIVSSLSIARALAGKPLRRELRVLGFDQEEQGLVGSAAYARQLSDAHTIDRLQGLFQIEMVAYDADHDRHYHVIDCQENRSAELTAAITATDHDLGLTRVEACTNRSDHASFWTYDRPAIVVSQNFFGGDSNPCYHRACDKVSAALDFTYMAKLTDAVANGVAATVLANP